MLSNNTMQWPTKHLNCVACPFLIFIAIHDMFVVDLFAVIDEIHLTCNSLTCTKFW